LGEEIISPPVFYPTDNILQAPTMDESKNTNNLNPVLEPSEKGDEVPSPVAGEFT
jgi:hypothetical protein